MDTVNSITEWFEKAIPSPKQKNIHVQLGVHFEEVSEMLQEMVVPRNHTEHEKMIQSVFLGMAPLADALKSGKITLDLTKIDRLKLLDSLCDQMVTAIGVAHMFNLNISSGLNEVDRSNWSKFVDGKPIFNENGKIIKGENYTPPELDAFV